MHGLHDMLRQSMSNSDGCVSSHSMSPQCHMHSSLSSAAPWRTDGCMAPIFTMEDKRTETEAGCLSLLPVCKEEVTPEQQERSSSLVQVKPEPLQIKEEQEEELLQRPVEAAGSTLTLLAVKREDDDNDAEPLASTSTKHMKTQAYINYCVPSSQPASDDQLLSSNCSESDITEDSDDWEEPREDQPALNKLNSKMFQDCGASQPTSEDQLLSSHCSESDTDDSDFWAETGEDQDLKSSKQTPSTEKTSCSCTECDRVFSDTSLLKRHMRTHTGHRGENLFASTGHRGENPLVCTVCSKVYRKIGRLRSHMRIHSGEFTCNECGKGFVWKKTLKRHMLTHTDEKPITCAVCGLVFPYMCQLKKHMVSHTGEKLFSCTECGKAFGLKGSLNKHMIIHTHTGESRDDVKAYTSHVKHTFTPDAFVTNHLGSALF